MSRSASDKKFFDDKCHESSNYWLEKGMSIDRLNSESTCVELKLEDPINPKEDYSPGFDLMNYMHIDWIADESKNWGLADLGDNMHAKSLHKRIASSKVEGDTSTITDFDNIMSNISSKLPNVDLTTTEKIKAALSTTGTAGQFSKRSSMEDVWKDPTSQFAADFWMNMVSISYKLTFLTDNIPEGLVAYMLYRKKECLEYDEEGEIKVTRLMNAPNLITRINDNISFKEYNDALTIRRGDIIPNLGINIFVELKMIIIYDEDLIAIELDFNDYDGSQQANQILVNCKARIRYMLRHNKSIEEIAYMLPRYRRHIHRRVNSTFGVTYRVLGQQASGDITTSDDNSQKTAVSIEMLKPKLIRNSMEKEGLVYNSNISDDENFRKMTNRQLIYNADAHGDDSFISTNITNLSTPEIEKEAITSSEKLGWKVKDGSLKVNKMIQDGKAKFLAHGIKTKKFATRSKNTILEFGVVVRESDRFAAKFRFAAEMEELITKEMRPKLTGKMLSFWMASLGHPDMIMACIATILRLASTSSDNKLPYTWTGIPAPTIGNVKLNKLIQMQVPHKMTKRFAYIEVNDLERCRINQVTDIINSKIIPYFNDLSRGVKLVKLTNNFDSNWWDHDKVVSWLRKNMEILHRSSHVVNRPETYRWWDDMDNNKDAVRLDATRAPKQLDRDKGAQDDGHARRFKSGLLTKCCKLNNTRLIFERESDYNLTQYCKKCWETRKERRYESISVHVQHTAASQANIIGRIFVDVDSDIGE